MKKRLFLLIFLALVLTPFLVDSIGISPDATYLKYEPLKEGNITIRILNTKNEAIEASLVFEGVFAKYFELDAKSKRVAKDGITPFVISYKFPYEPDSHGSNQVIVKVKEKSVDSSGVAAIVSVISKIIVDVPYPDKYLEFNFKLDNANIAETAVASFNIQNRGEDNIFTVRPYFNVYSLNNLNESVKYYESEKMFSMTKDSNRNEIISFNTSEIGIGEYYIESFLDYDGIISKPENDTFIVGYKDVNVINYTDILISGAIKEVDVYLRNEWNADVQNVYLQAYVEKEGSPISQKSFSHTVNMKALEVVKIPVFLDITNLIEGNYNLVLDIYYGGLVKQEKLPLKIKKGFEISPGMIAAIAIIILIVIDIGWMLLKKESVVNKDKSEEKLKKLFGK